MNTKSIDIPQAREYNRSIIIKNISMNYKQKDYMVKYRQHNKRTVNGWTTKVYGRMKLSSKERGHQPPLFSKQELKEWAIKNGLEKIMEIWIKSGCQKNKTPSINRLNDYKGYTFDNMELTTWEDNNIKGRGSIKTKELVHSKLGNTAKKMFSKPIIKSDLNNKVLAIYPSVREAARQNNTDSGSIAHVCRGEKHTHHKLKWSYVTNRQT